MPGSCRGREGSRKGRLLADAVFLRASALWGEPAPRSCGRLGAGSAPFHRPSSSCQPVWLGRGGEHSEPVRPKFLCQTQGLIVIRAP